MNDEKNILIFDDGNDEEDDDLVEEQEGKQLHHWIFQSSEVFQAHFSWDIRGIVMRRVNLYCSILTSHNFSGISIPVVFWETHRPHRGRDDGRGSTRFAVQGDLWLEENIINNALQCYGWFHHHDYHHHQWAHLDHITRSCPKVGGVTFIVNNLPNSIALKNCENQCENVTVKTYQKLYNRRIQWIYEWHWQQRSFLSWACQGCRSCWSVGHPADNHIWCTLRFL